MEGTDCPLKGMQTKPLHPAMPLSDGPLRLDMLRFAAVSWRRRHPWQAKTCRNGNGCQRGSGERTGTYPQESNQQTRQQIQPSKPLKCYTKPLRCLTLIQFSKGPARHIQRRVVLVWTRLILPDTSSVALDRLPGIDPAGYSELKGWSPKARVWREDLVENDVAVQGSIGTHPAAMLTGLATWSICRLEKPRLDDEVHRQCDHQANGQGLEEGGQPLAAEDERQSQVAPRDGRSNCDFDHACSDK